jgi:hypothetical protein
LVRERSRVQSSLAAPFFSKTYAKNALALEGDSYHIATTSPSRSLFGYFGSEFA